MTTKNQKVLTIAEYDALLAAAKAFHKDTGSIAMAVGCSCSVCMHDRKIMQQLLDAGFTFELDGCPNVKH